MYENITLAQSFNYAYQNVIVKLIQYLPFLLSAILILILGWFLSIFIARSLNRLLRVLGAHKAFEEAGVNSILEKAGSKRDAIALISHVVKWVLLLVVFMAAVQALQLPAVSQFFDKMIAYMPNVLAGIFILLLGAITANLIEKIIEGALKAGKIGYGPALGVVARYSILAFAVIAALSQLGIARELLQIFFSGLVLMLAISGGLAFGLGGQETARELLAKLKKEVK